MPKAEKTNSAKQEMKEIENEEKKANANESSE